MASPAQIEANRRNSQKSTGPTSAAGKAVSRFNALKSGIDAKSQVIPGEDPAELAALAANYQLEFQPASPLEQFLVDSLVNADWKLRRLGKVEAQLWRPESAAEDDFPMGRSLTRLYRAIDTRERSYFRALKELQREQAARQTEVSVAPECAGTPADSPQPAPEIACGTVISEEVQLSPAPPPAASLPRKYPDPATTPLGQLIHAGKVASLFRNPELTSISVSKEDRPNP
jgi:hypothetical protein